MKTLLLAITLLLSVSIFAGPVNSITGKRDTKSTISFKTGGSPYRYIKNDQDMTFKHGGVELGINYSYFLTKKVELELGIGGVVDGIFATIGAKYHFYINNNLTTFISANSSYLLNFNTHFDSYSSLIGLRYETDSGFTTSLGAGILLVTDYTIGTKGADGSVYVPSTFQPYASIKLGYSF